MINVIDFHFQSPRFKSSTFGSSYTIISQMVTEMANLAIANTGIHIKAFDWHIAVWPWPVLDVGTVYTKYFGLLVYKNEHLHFLINKPFISWYSNIDRRYLFLVWRLIKMPIDKNTFRYRKCSARGRHHLSTFKILVSACIAMQSLIHFGGAITATHVAL